LLKWIKADIIKASFFKSMVKWSLNVFKSISCIKVHVKELRFIGPISDALLWHLKNTWLLSSDRQHHRAGLSPLKESTLYRMSCMGFLRVVWLLPQGMSTGWVGIIPLTDPFTVAVFRWRGSKILGWLIAWLIMSFI
jgi:hypothetical protein